ncbi:MAG: RDD family protein [Pseudomonadota bacterium]
MQVNLAEVSYAGFWARFFATVLDTIIQALILVPILLAIYGREMFSNTSFGMDTGGMVLQYALPMLWALLFWKYKSATPGKMLMGMSIVDATTGATPTFGRLVMRYLGYYVSIIPCLLGFFWVGWDKRKQGFHDMIANTVVIMNPDKDRAQV